MRVGIIFILVVLTVVGCVPQQNWETKPSCPKGGGVIIGTVTDSYTGEPVVAVSVALLNTEKGDLTRPNGEYQICDVPEGQHTLRFTSIDYRSVNTDSINVTNGDTVIVDQVLVKMDSTERANQKVIYSNPPTRLSTSETTVDSMMTKVPRVQTNEKGDVFIRGGRNGEVSYIVEGKPVSGGLEGTGSAGANLSLVSDSTGSIVGVITDKETDEPVIGTSVAIVGTIIGGQTDLEGKYEIKCLLPGTYTIRITSIEYATIELTDVVVQANVMAEVNRALVKKAEGVDKTIPVIGKRTRGHIGELIDPVELWPEPVTTVDSLFDMIDNDTTEVLYIKGPRASQKAYVVEMDSINWPDRDDSFGSIAGVITDSATGKPIVNASVAIWGTTLTVQTDLNGQYEILRLKPGVYAVRIVSTEYGTVEHTKVEVLLGETTDVNQALERKTAEHDRVVTVIGEIDIIEHVCPGETIQWPDRDDSTGFITGVITDKDNGEPIPDVAVSIDGDTVGVVTNSKGEYQLDQICSGVYRLKLYSVRHVTTVVTKVDVRAGMRTKFDFAMRIKNPELARMLFVPAEVDTVDASQQ